MFPDAGRAPCRSAAATGSWPFDSQEHHVVEQGAGTTVGAHRDLGTIDLRARACTSQLLDTADHSLQHLARRASVAVRHHPAVGGHRVLAIGLDGATHDEVTTFSFSAEAEGLELPDDLERERVVELAHVDVGGPQ